MDKKRLWEIRMSEVRQNLGKGGKAGEAGKGGELGQSKSEREIPERIPEGEGEKQPSCTWCCWAPTPSPPSPKDKELKFI